MKRKLIAALCALMTVSSASAFAPWLAMAGVAAVEYVGLPVCYALGCAFAYSPAVRCVGIERAVCGLDWGSLACHAGDVYGLQASFVGGSFEKDLCGLQFGIFASGYAQEELPFGDYHFFDIGHCRMNGIQFGTFAAKTATANGLQLSAVYAEARTLNGLQVGLVNRSVRLHGLQVGLYNQASRGLGLQLGLLNCTDSGLAGFLPVLNLVY